MTALEERPKLKNLKNDLVVALRGDVDLSTSAQALFASDASNYRIVPLGVVFPRDEADVLAILEIAGRYGISVIQRGGGTSTGGQTVGSGLVVDYSRYFDHVIEVSPTQDLARVEPGTVLDKLQAEAQPFGLRFGPDPSTHDRCTIGGMIGNNACGAHSMRWGKTDENVLALRVATVGAEVLDLSTIEVLKADPAPFAQQLATKLEAFVERYADAIRTQTGPPMSRRVSGYGLTHLLPEHGGNIARALVGSEGTCVALLEATVHLVRPPASRVLLLLGFADHYLAADFVPTLLAFEPLTIEGLDARLVELARNTNESGAGVSLLPDGNGWLLLEIGADNLGAAHERAEQIIGEIGYEETSRIIDDPQLQRAVWRLREDGAGLATRLPDGSEAWPGWEDAAVPPEHLGTYLRKFDALLAKHGRQGMLFGHFGEGCMHVRIDFDFLSEEGRTNFRAFIEDAADLVVSLGGSLSGEHGDGQARGELLHKMYPPVLIEAFREFKEIFDPAHQMNPGNIVNPRHIDDDLRIRTPVHLIRKSPNLALHVDHGDLEVSARRCVGIGKCRRLDGGAMCPSFQVTRNERDSTRGRARLLTEMFAGDLVTDGWRSKEVLESLDLCLSCKACASDCPVGVDMAAYKAEFLSHYYEGRLRPRAHYALGHLPALLRLFQPITRLSNWLVQSPLAPVIKFLGGIDQQRSLPLFAHTTLQQRVASTKDTPTVILWPDTFTNFLSPEVGEAAIEVLAALGARVAVPTHSVCCGLTWYSTGQIEEARKVLGPSLESIAEIGDDTTPLLVLEPSCASMLREEITEILPNNALAQNIAQRVVSFGEYVKQLLQASGEQPFQQSSMRYLAQVHCHQRATVGYTPEVDLLDLLGTSAVELENNCCGLAGNFGFEAGHYEISKAIADRGILARVNHINQDLDIQAETIVVADGFSCRTQINELSTTKPKHLAEVLRDALRSSTPEH
jgi:FAD/FMN-containing dehydrogenase/Fe-S oxidoreductase